ncbi:MAG: hypothetical protein WDN04_14200 [Rhodospirillales bacterium]
MRKLLASSTFAIAGALDSLARKLERQLKEDKDHRDSLKEELAADFEELDEVEDEWSEQEENPEILSDDNVAAMMLNSRPAWIS